MQIRNYVSYKNGYRKEWASYDKLYKLRPIVEEHIEHTSFIEVPISLESLKTEEVTMYKRLPVHADEQKHFNNRRYYMKHISKK